MRTHGTGWATVAGVVVVALMVTPLTVGASPNIRTVHPPFLALSNSSYNLSTNNGNSNTWEYGNLSYNGTSNVVRLSSYVTWDKSSNGTACNCTTGLHSLVQFSLGAVVNFGPAVLYTGNVTFEWVVSSYSLMVIKHLNSTSLTGFGQDTASFFLSASVHAAGKPNTTTSYGSRIEATSLLPYESLTVATGKTDFWITVHGVTFRKGTYTFETTIGLLTSFGIRPIGLRNYAHVSPGTYMVAGANASAQLQRITYL